MTARIESADRQGVFRRVPVDEGVDLLIWTTPKFKTISLRVDLLEDLDERAAARSLAAAVLQRGTVSCPDMMTLSRRLEELFGARLALDVAKRGERQPTILRLDLVHPRFLRGAASLFGQGLALAWELLLEPAIERASGGREAFRAAEFEQERKNLERAIVGLRDDKIAYARQRLVEEMFQGEPYARTELGTLDEVAALDPAEVLGFHRERVATAPIDAWLVGEVTDAEIEAFAARLRALPRSGTLRPPSGPVVRAAKPTRTVVERAEVAQSKLDIGYRLDPTGIDDRGHVALGLLNGVLGGGSTSKLFKEVREKRSLAYYASSSLDRLKGACILSAGVAAAQWEAAAEVMHAQVAATKRGDVSAQEIELARAAILNALRSLNDSPHQAIEYVSNARAAGRPPDTEQVAAIVRSLGRDDVVAAAARLVEDTTFVLLGPEVEQGGDDGDAAQDAR